MALNISPAVLEVMRTAASAAIEAVDTQEGRADAFLRRVRDEAMAATGLALIGEHGETDNLPAMRSIAKSAAHRIIGAAVKGVGWAAAGKAGPKETPLSYATGTYTLPGAYRPVTFTVTDVTSVADNGKRYDLVCTPQLNAAELAELAAAKK